jgi:hypothetical protein
MYLYFAANSRRVKGPCLNLALTLAPSFPATLQQMTICRCLCMGLSLAGCVCVRVCVCVPAGRWRTMLTNPTEKGRSWH